MARTDEQLVAATLAGDLPAFDELMQRYERLIYSLVVSFATNSDEALDLTQEIFLKAYRKLASFGGRGSLKGWLARIAIHEGINSAKSASRRQARHEAWHIVREEHQTAAQDTRVLARERERQVAAALRELAPRHRLAIELRYLREMSIREIAVGARVQRGRRPQHSLPRPAQAAPAARRSLVEPTRRESRRAASKTQGGPTVSHSTNHDALIDALFEGRATPEEAARLLDGAGDEELGELAELVETLARIDPGEEMPSVVKFADARQSVLDRIAASERPRASRTARWLPLAAALAAFAVGLAIPRGTAEPAPELTLTDLVARGAGAGTAGESPFRYSNLRLREAGAGALAVTVDVEAQLDLVRPKNDPLVSDILANSLVSDDSLGTRLKAVRLAGGSPRLREALASAALGDPEPSVRLKALERLIEEDVTSTETQEVLLAVLSREESVAMRLLALDAIEDDYLGSDLLESLDTQDDQGAVLWHAQQRVSRRSL